MDLHQKENILAQVVPLVEDTGSFIRSHFRKVQVADADAKSLNSLVSFVDIEAEKKLVQGLRSIVPQSTFVTEEDTVAENPSSSIQWIIDPLDGTTNFLRGIPVFSISLALTVDQEIVLGVVYDIMHQDMYTAIRGNGAMVNGNPLHCTKVDQLKEAVIATGFPYQPYSEDHPMFTILNQLIVEARGLRRLGSAAIDLAFVARGVYDVYYEARLNPWDIAAGILLVQEAGGQISDFTGQNNSLNNGTVVASNGYLHDTMLKRLHEVGLPI